MFAVQSCNTNTGIDKSAFVNTANNRQEAFYKNEIIYWLSVGSHAR